MARSACVGLVIVLPAWASPTEAQPWEVPAGCWLSPGRLFTSWSQVFNGDRKKGRRGQGTRVPWVARSQSRLGAAPPPEDPSCHLPKIACVCGQVCQGWLVLPVGSATPVDSGER